MGRRAAAKANGAHGVLARLRRDTAGNTLAMMAIALIPVSAFAGSAIDISRLYVVKSRLQQACDAGVLAGRKFMTDASKTALEPAADAQARAFFANNFTAGWLQTSAVVFTPAKTSENQVSGTATATVPMTIMKMFNATDATVSVSCEARYDVADADIMFVLDTTGSMACLTSMNQSDCDNYVVANTVQNSDGSYSVTEMNNSRIDGLRDAVDNFYKTVSATADPTTHFRYGLVPYSATVNVGRILQPLGYMASGSWKYQSREVVGDANASSPAATTKSTTGVTQATCQGAANNYRSPATGYLSNGTANVYSATWSSASGGTCAVKNQTVIPNWKYWQETFPIDQYVAGNTVTNPAQVTGATSRWNGCVEERGDPTTATSFSATTPPLELDVDTAPSAGNASSYWRPMWTDVLFSRQSTPETSSAARTTNTRFQFGTYFGTQEIAPSLNELPCPAPAQRLASMSESTLTGYLQESAGFRPYGNTYHDVGITWGTRLLSPTGMFASDTSAWPGHNPPNRYIIFLTDGAMETDEYAYSAWGIEQFDNRAGSNGNSTTLTNVHNSRFTTACQIAAAHNITIFVIAYAQTLTTQLQNCASPGQAYYASDTTSLNTAFSKIARQVAMLRVSK